MNFLLLYCFFFVHTHWESCIDGARFYYLFNIWCMEFSGPEYWSEQPFHSPGDLPNPGIEPRSPALQAESLPAEPQGKPNIRCLTQESPCRACSINTGRMNEGTNTGRMNEAMSQRSLFRSVHCSGHCSCPKISISSFPSMFLSLTHQKPWYLPPTESTSKTSLLSCMLKLLFTRNGQLALWELIFLQPSQRNTQAKHNQN